MKLSTFIWIELILPAFAFLLHPVLKTSNPSTLHDLKFLQCATSDTDKLSNDGNEFEWLLQRVKLNIKPQSVIVIKYGGHAMENDDLRELFYQDIATLYKELDIIPIIVHGGGPQIAKMLNKLGVESKFVNGLRVTDPATMDAAKMVLCGSINKDISSSISQIVGIHGCIGLSGLDSKLIIAKQKDPELGMVGEPTMVNAQVIQELVGLKLIPVIAPVGINEKDGTCLNINADTAAGSIAEALKADYFLLLTDIAGVLNKDKQLISKLSVGEVSSMMSDGTIIGGMIPKLETASNAIGAGVGEVSIADGRVQHCILRALSGESFGTKVSR